MKTKEKITLVVLAVTVALWVLAAAKIGKSINLLLIYGAIVCSIVCLGLAGSCLAGRMKKRISPYLSFGIINAVIELVIVAYSQYDIRCNSGMMAGVIGKLLMYFIAPVPVILIIIDVIVYLVKKTDNRFK